jgi:hypothetical protein
MHLQLAALILVDVAGTQIVELLPTQTGRLEKSDKGLPVGCLEVTIVLFWSARAGYAGPGL